MLSTLLDRARCHGVTEVLGATQAAHDLAVAYAGDRHQFGEPIGDTQAIKFKLADNAATLAAARGLIYDAARACWTTVATPVENPHSRTSSPPTAG